jgi:hypothetical protein
MASQRSFKNRAENAGILSESEAEGLTSQKRRQLCDTKGPLF